MTGVNRYQLTLTARNVKALVLGRYRQLHKQVVRTTSPEMRMTPLELSVILRIHNQAKATAELPRIRSHRKPTSGPHPSALV